MISGGGGGSGSASYDALFQGLVDSGCVAGLALLDAARGRPLYENRVDDRLPRPPPPAAASAGAAEAGAEAGAPAAATGKDNHYDEKKAVGARGLQGPSHRYGLVSPSEGQRLVSKQGAFSHAPFSTSRCGHPFNFNVTLGMSGVNRQIA